MVDQMDEDERRGYVAWLEMTKDHEIVKKCREGKVKKYVGRGVVILNYQWWRERIEKTGFRAVPTDEDMEGAEHDRREGKTDRAD
jgi:hypothetical protein